MHNTSNNRPDGKMHPSCTWDGFFNSVEFEQIINVNVLFLYRFSRMKECATILSSTYDCWRLLNYRRKKSFLKIFLKEARLWKIFVVRWASVLAQVVTNRQQTCSNAVPTTCQQDVFALLVPSLWTTCYKVVELNRLVTSCSNNSLSSCNSTICQQVVSDNLVGFVATWCNNSLVTTCWQACYEPVANTSCWQVVRFLHVYIIFLVKQYIIVHSVWYNCKQQVVHASSNYDKSAWITRPSRQHLYEFF
jgi:hypothetical protein